MSVDRFTRLEEDVRRDHSLIEEEDQCFFWREWTQGVDYRFGETNDLINNLKKPTIYRNRPAVWQHKQRAIRRCASAISQGLNRDWLARATLVPVPPSKAKSDPEYDDRMLQVLQQVDVGQALDIRELVEQRESTRASHASGDDRNTVEELLAVSEINEAQTQPWPETIGIVDDMLVAGVHFAAMKRILRERFPDVPIYGIFIARRVFREPPVEEFL